VKAASIASKTAQGAENSPWAIDPHKSTGSAPTAPGWTACPVPPRATIGTRTAAGGFDDRGEILRHDGEISLAAGDRGLSIPSERAREQNRRRGSEHEFAHRFFQVFYRSDAESFHWPREKSDTVECRRVASRGL
jgi:hypothetical protein